MSKSKIVLLAILLFFSACSVKKIAEQPVANTEWIENLGHHHFPITTQSRNTQRYFNKGLILAYAFNHQESIKSFNKAILHDPHCAMCYWGIAYSLGPNLNAAMEDSVVAEAYQAIQKANSLAHQVSNKEQAIIKALILRYAAEPVTDRGKLNQDYANAMRIVAANFSEDADTLTLFADALMNQHPWDYWTADGQEKSWTAEIVQTLENALVANPLHPGANHLYIHAVEASDRPERALPSAERLETLVPGSGHLVHMPAHIYIRTGHYHKAVLANRKAVAVDKNFLHHHPNSTGIYPLAYVPHNHHFLWAAAAIQGRSVEAISAAQSTASHVDQKAMRQPGMGTLEHYYAMPLYAFIRFGKWQEILQQSPPTQDLRYANAVWHYARGMAFLALNDLDSAGKELARLKALANEPDILKMSIWDMNTVPQILIIASKVLAGEINAKQGEFKTAIALLDEAVQLEDQLRYNEPSDWYYPVRQSLGAVLLQADQAATAENIYREDLKKNKENGWSLYGLMKSLAIQNKLPEAFLVQQRFEQAWSNADIAITASRIID